MGDCLMATLKINGDTSGYVELVSPAVAGSTSIELDKILVSDSNGRVGIGTSSPAQELDVNGQVRGVDRYYFKRASDNYSLSALARWDGSTGSPLTGTAGIHTVVGSEEASSSVIFAPSNTERMRIDANGNIGINTSSAVPLDTNAQLLAIHGDAVGAERAQIKLTTTTSGQAANDGFYIAVDDSAAYISQRENQPLVFLTNATEAMRIDSSGNVGINASNPDFKFNVVGSTNYETVKLYYTETANVTQRLGIAGRNYENTNNIGIIAMYDDGNNCVINVGGGFNAPDNIEFRTGSSSAVRMNIDPSGNLIVGNAGASFTGDRLQVESPSNEPVASFYRPRNTVGGGLVRFMSDVGGTQTIVAQVTSEGNFVTNGGINFGGSVNSGGTVSSSNTLDDYEEGTWTPITSSGTMSGGSGSYIKIGAFVTLIYRWSSISGGSGQVNISGLPFARSTSLGNLSPASGNCMWDGIDTTRGITPYLGSNTMTFYGNGSGNSNSWWYLQHSNANGSTQPLEVYGSIWYYTDQ
jgi:hypothetical protein